MLTFRGNAYTQAELEELKAALLRGAEEVPTRYKIVIYDLTSAATYIDKLIGKEKSK